MTVNLTESSELALKETQRIIKLNMTDVINRAVIFYSLLVKFVISSPVISGDITEFITDILSDDSKYGIAVKKADDE